MISHVLVYLLAHGGKGPILHTLCHAYKMGVQPFGLSDWLYAHVCLNRNNSSICRSSCIINFGVNLLDFFYS